MRNLRKTRKRGGFNTATVLNCVSPYATLGKCETEFLKLNNFKKIKVPGDGNCFYHALSKYYSLSNPPGSRPPTHLQLRERVVDVMDDNFEEATVALIINTSNIPNNMGENDKKTIRTAKYLEALNELREDGIWNSDNADLVSQYAARALNVKLNIFNKMAPQAARRIHMRTTNNGTKIYEDFPAEPAKIVRYTFEPPGYAGAETINLLRVSDSHYELLYPKAVEAVPDITPKGKKTNAVKNLTAKVGKIELANKSRTVRVPSPLRAPETISRYALRSKTNKKPVVAPVISTPKKEPRRTKANIEAAELQAAIAASLQNSHKPLPNNFLNIFENNLN